MAPTPHAQLIAIKQWADRGLYEAVEAQFDRLSKEDRILMLRILDHILTVDRIFQHHLQGLPHGFKAPRSDTLPDLQTLKQNAKTADDWYAAYVGGLTERECEQAIAFTFTSGKPALMTRGEIILHVCLHGTYHRGNAGALLQLRGLTPSRDSVTDYLEAAA